MREIGSRVGAIRFANEKTVYLFGYGVYDGDIPCPNLDGIPNPRITLDNGEIVWGCECWWGSEQQIKDKIGDREVIIVSFEKDDVE